MSTQPPNQTAIDPPCSVILYRTIRRQSWFDPDNTNRVMAEAFARRSPKLEADGSVNPGDDDGLSVFDAARISQQDCIQDSRSCYGLATLHVGTLRDFGLEVIRDPQDNRKVLIVNVPFENSNDASQEALLEAVSLKAKIAIRCRHKKQA